MALLPFRFKFRHFAVSNRAVLIRAETSWPKCNFQRTNCAQLSAIAGQPLVLKASAFGHLFEPGPTEAIYSNTPVRALGQQQQGELLQEWARRMLQEKNPRLAFLDPEPGIRQNGCRRALHQSAYDFLMGGRRVEVKSGRLAWDSTHRSWYARFGSVKLPYGERAEATFDDLYLVIMSPKGLQLIKHDLITGVSTNGKATEVDGHKIQVNGGRNNKVWKDALTEVMRKLLHQGDCTLVAEESFNKLDFSKTFLTSEQSESLPLPASAGALMCAMSSSKRGKHIQTMGCGIDQILNPFQEFSLTLAGGSTSVQKRGTSNASVDWVRGATRVELKSSRMCWVLRHRRWQCNFRCIKPHLFDELWLVICSPVGIHFYRSESPGHLAFSRSGVATDHLGLQKAVYGRSQQDNPLEALKTIGAKLISEGCELVAMVAWDMGSLPSQTSVRKK